MSALPRRSSARGTHKRSRGFGAGSQVDGHVATQHVEELSTHTYSHPHRISAYAVAPTDPAAIRA